MPNTNSINLLRGKQTHYTDTILKWALTTGRFLIIVTETIALSAFVYRFTLDREIVDLTDKIRNNSAVVSLYKQEPHFRNLQERLDFIGVTLASQNDSSNLLQQLVTQAQGKVIFQKVLISEKSVELELTTSSTGALSSFMNGLKTIPLIKNVSVTKVENKANTGEITVGILAQLTNQKGEATNGTK